MPRYDYLCKPCDKVFEAVVPMATRRDMLCPSCHNPVQMTFIVPPYTQSPRHDAYYNHGQGYFDYGLGTFIRGRRHREEVMAAKGVMPLKQNLSREEVQENPVPVGKIKISTEDFRDARELGQARLRQGWKPQTTQQIIDRVKKP